MSARPELSVIVTVVSGAESVRRALTALCPDGRSPKGVEILVPIEKGLDDVAVLGVEFDDVQFPDLGVLPLTVQESGPFQEHERYDLRRSAGLLLAEGAVIAVIEDHGTPATDFCAAVLTAHQRLPHPAIGGTVTNLVPRAMNDALWLCDFGRYAPPRAEGPSPTLTDVCVSYKREALLPIRHVFAERFHEPELHGALAADGRVLWLDPKITVGEERPWRPIRHRVAERFAWGRLYGKLRSQGWGGFRRFFRAATSAVLVPPVLLFRALRIAGGRISFGRIAAALPALALLTIIWGLGEGFGTLFPTSGGQNHGGNAPGPK